MSELKKCNRCKKEKEMSCFICKRGKERKNCDKCRARFLRNTMCIHNKSKGDCIVCNGSGICIHNKRRRTCKECKGSGICEHNRERNSCKKCEGSGICEHNRSKYYCKECKGSCICEHNKKRSRCKECKGNEFCKHNRIKYICKDCNPNGHLIGCIRSRMGKALKAKKTKKTMEYLGCTIEEFKKHIEEQFTEGMTWENHGEWHIDHIIPLKYENPSIEEVIERLHYKNTQPLWAEENIAKGNHYIG